MTIPAEAEAHFIAALATEGALQLLADVDFLVSSEPLQARAVAIAVDHFVDRGEADADMIAEAALSFLAAEERYEPYAWSLPLIQEELKRIRSRYAMRDRGYGTADWLRRCLEHLEKGKTRRAKAALGGAIRGCMSVIIVHELEYVRRRWT